MNLGPPWRLGRERMTHVHQLAPPVASVFAPLPMALIMAVVNAEPQSAITTLVTLSFPMTLIIGLLFFLVRGVGLIGWASAIVGGLIAAGVMMNLLNMVPPPDSIDALRAEGERSPVDATGALSHFFIPGAVTALSFWAIIRLQCHRAFATDAGDDNPTSTDE